jgi:hypothetical protein
MFDFLFNRSKEVPEFNQYYPTLEAANNDQKKYFNWFIKQLQKGKKPDIEGNLSYVFIFLYKTINRFIQNRDYESFSNNFEAITPYAYEYETIEKYFYKWRRDAAILVGNWQEVWEHGRKCKLDTTIVSYCISKAPSIKITANDLYAFLDNKPGLTNFGSDNINAVNKIADEILNEHRQAKGANFLRSFLKKYDWPSLTENEVLEIADECEYLFSVRKFKNALKKVGNQSTKTYTLFGSVPMDMVHSRDKSNINGISFETKVSVRADKPTKELEKPNPVLKLVIIAKSKSLLREAENLLRERRELPRIGEGWISETKLYQEIKNHFEDTAVVQHARPEWLKPQHFDVFLPLHKVAIEFQGAQHIRPVDYFGGEKAFKKQQKRDARKAKLCEENNCELIEVFQDYEPKKVFNKISSAINEDY